MIRYQQRRVGVLDRETGQAIAPSASSPEWRQYLRWVAAGNTPDPMPTIITPPSPAETAARQELAARNAMRAVLRADPTVTYLRSHTPQEVEAWVTANVTDLVSARNTLAKLAMVVAYLARERLKDER